MDKSPKVSVIVCTCRPELCQKHRQNVEKTIGCEVEYIPILNTDNKFSMASAYNEGARQATGDILLFTHDDVFFLKDGWGPVLSEKFSQNPDIGAIGLAGTQYIFEAPLLKWLDAGWPFVQGRVIHRYENKFVLTAYSWEKTDQEVVAVDGLFIAIPANVFKHIKFDGETFDGFHFYDLDICMQVRQTHQIVVTFDIYAVHHSPGCLDQNWANYGNKFLAKYDNELPAYCTEFIPERDNTDKKFYESIDMTKVVKDDYM